MLNISGKALAAIIGVTAASTVAVCTVANPIIMANTSYTTPPTEFTSNSSNISSYTTSANSEESSAENSSSQVSSKATSSKTIEQRTNEGVSKIKKATDDGVSTIQKAKNEAVAEVKKATKENTSSSVLSNPAHEVECGENRITGTNKGGKWSLECQGYLSKVDEDNKSVIISYGGSFSGHLWDAQTLIDGGFKLTNAAGKEIEYLPYKFCQFKVPYTTLSDVSEMYFCYENQKIKITVS